MQVKFIVVGGATRTSEVRLKLPAVIGRGHDASLMLSHPLVSRRHCEITEVQGQLVVRDLGSLNGTYIGRQRITQAVLPPNGLLTVGTVTFRAVYDAHAAELSAVAGSDGLARPPSSAEQLTVDVLDEGTHREPLSRDATPPLPVTEVPRQSPPEKDVAGQQKTPPAGPSNRPPRR